LYENTWNKTWAFASLNACLTNQKVESTFCVFLMILFLTVS